MGQGGWADWNEGGGAGRSAPACMDASFHSTFINMFALSQGLHIFSLYMGKLQRNGASENPWGSYPMVGQRLSSRTLQIVISYHLRLMLSDAGMAPSHLS